MKSMSNKQKLRGYQMLSFLLFILPFIILVLSFKEMFLIAQRGMAITFYGYLIALFALVALKDKVITSGKKNPLLSMSIAMLITAVVMKSFASELIMIATTGIIGSLLSAIIEPVVRVYENEVYEWNGERKNIRREQTELSDKEAWQRAYT